MPPAVWTVVESPNSADSPPLVEAGVLQSSAVFDGVPVRVNDLAPVPTSEVDEALLPMIAQFASLAPHPLAAGEAAPLASIDATQETGRKPWFGEAGAGSDLTGEQLDRMDAAVAMLQRPLNQVSLSQGLHKREPPDLALAATPATAPHTVWGEPWPNVRLSRFRYTVPFNHRPLYFEQPNFERCGESWGLFSPYVSAANFAGNVVMLPVHALLDPPWTCVPTLGDCPSCYRYDFCPIFGNRE